jgi:HMW1-like protein
VTAGETAAEAGAPPSLAAFERAVARRAYEPALIEAIGILGSVDDRYGAIDGVAGAPAPGAERRLQSFATRFAAAFGALIADPAAPLTPAAFERLMLHHRWIELMFSASGFGSSEHLVSLLAAGDGVDRRVPAETFARFLLIFSAAAGMDLNLDEGVSANPAVMVTAALAYLGGRFCFSDRAHALRERLLAWLPARLPMVQLGELALQHLASPYLHCSYATAANKHAIKAPLIAQMRRGLEGAGCPQRDPAQAPARAADGRATVVVTAESFSLNHSVWRTHSLAVKALRARFRVVGLLYPNHISPEIAECFDEIAPLQGESFYGVVRQAAADILARRPAMVLHLGVGLSSIVIGLASLRLAPVQAASFGHTATTGSPEIDAMILPDDFVGDPACFAERLVRLPAAAMPYRLRADVDYAAVKAGAAAARSEGDSVRIAVPASVMKLGPPLFAALAAATEGAARPAQLQFFPLGANGLGHAELVRRVAARLPGAVVHPELPYDAYIARLAACDAFASPFPYGNMNSIVDAAMVGLPGVCLDGPEAHAHADAAYFRRLGLPEALIAQSAGDYVAALRALIDDPARLAAARAAARGIDATHPFFTADAALFADAIERLVAEALAR